MKRQGNYLMKNYLRRKSKAQATIEFSLAFVLAILFLFLTCNLFVWLNHNIVQRQRGYEASRKDATSIHTPGKLDFYTQQKINLFVPGGIEKK